MAIDIRADITCSLGPVISASLSDDYIQGNGIIKCSGTCEIAAIVTPAPGTVVTFQYTKNGITRHVPRKMRVLSSFADPFSRTTSVELGCKLTYLQDLAPRYEEKSKQTAQQLQCLNEYTEYSKDTELPVPFRASDIMAFCLIKLGITATSNPLTNVFYEEEGFDYSNGYVNVLSDLLISESYCGYLTYGENLEIFSLDRSGEAGPVITQDKVIDIAKIGVGGLPGDAVVVRYNALRFNAEENSESTQIPEQQRNWTRDETRGPERTISVAYTHPNTGDQELYNVTIEDYSETVTEYGEDRSWDPDTCVLISTLEEEPDLSNSVIKRIQRTLVNKGIDAANHCANLLSNGQEPGIGISGFIETETIYEYDNKGNPIKERTVTREPFFSFAGKTQLQDVVEEPQGQIFYVSWGNEMVTTQIEEVETIYIYASPPPVLFLKENEKFEPVISGRKEIRNTWTTWLHSMQGSSAIAWMNANAPFTSTEALLEYYGQISQTMVKQESVVSTSGGRLVIGGQVRPARYMIDLQEKGAQRGEEIAELSFITGSAASERVVEFSMPYQSEDYLTDTTPPVVVKGDAQEKALVYGRVQNKLLLGNRSGINLQVAPEILPSAPFEPFYLQVSGLSALYRTNGTSWTMDSSGIVVSTDALFWGGAGGTGTPWFPVAPGIVTLPSTPATEDTSPDQIIGTVPTVGTSPQNTLNTAFPSAMNGDGVQDQTTDRFWVYNGSQWIDVGTTPGPTIEASTIVPPWNEIITTDATVKSKIDVTSFNYPLLKTEQITPFVLSGSLGIGKIAPVRVPFTGLSIQADSPRIEVGAAIRPPEVNCALSAFSPTIISGASVKINAINLGILGLQPGIRTGFSAIVTVVDFGLEASTPASVGKAPLLVTVPALNLIIAGNLPNIRTGASISIPVANIQVQAQNVTFVTSISADPYFAYTSLLLHMNGSDGSTVFQDSSDSSMAIYNYGDSQISTVQSKFGGASAYFDGNGDFLYCPDNDEVFSFGNGDFTYEFWFRSSSTAPYATLLARDYGNFVVCLNGSTDDGAPEVYWYYGENSLLFKSNTSGFNNGNWHHYALVRSSGTCRMFIDGIQVASKTGVNTSVATSGIYIGYDPTLQRPAFQGYIDDLRITRGVARYTANFIPPADPHPGTGIANYGQIVDSVTESFDYDDISIYRDIKLDYTIL